MDAEIYPVAGGYHARDPRRRIVTFGRNEDEARDALEAAIARSERLSAVFAAQPRFEPTHESA